ncbi:hypothetical protein BHE74_00003608 [Ensete ventricosum]|nr:hypothetical protein BHE74_00003608 [Ensete ventricosum]
MYRSVLGMVHTELYRAILSILTYGTWERIDVPPVPAPYWTWHVSPVLSGIYPMIFISDVSTCQCVMEGFDLVFRAEPSPSNGSISKGEVSAQVIP